MPSFLSSGTSAPFLTRVMNTSLSFVSNVWMKAYDISHTKNDLNFRNDEDNKMDKANIWKKKN